MRFIGIIDIASFNAASSISIIPVSISPGAMQFTVIFALRQFNGQRFGGADDPRLGGAIVDLTAVAHHAGYGRERDDTPAPGVR